MGSCTSLSSVQPSVQPSLEPYAEPSVRPRTSVPEWNFQDRSTEQCLEECKEQRTVRLFVSSTFRDFRAERTAFNLELFPRLSRFCAERGYTFLPVELQWGITDNDRLKSKISSICVSEVLRCRPYFLCLLGEYYGWCTVTSDEPELLIQDLREAIKKYPWVSKWKDRSITEIEIRSATLNNGSCIDSSRSWFFFRNPDISRSLHHDTNDTALRQLADLKKEIKSRFFVHDNYTSVDSIVEEAYTSITQALEKDLGPPLALKDKTGADKFDAHSAYVKIRLMAYVPRVELEKTLMQYTASDDPNVLCIKGSSGTGKSSLLCKFAHEMSSAHAHGDTVVYHFIGATNDSSQLEPMLQRILQSIKEARGSSVIIPESDEKLRTAFGDTLLEMAATGQGRTILILDGLDQLANDAQKLLWLPCKLHPKLRIVTSVLEDDGSGMKKAADNDSDGIPFPNSSVIIEGGNDLVPNGHAIPESGGNETVENKRQALNILCERGARIATLLPFDKDSKRRAIVAYLKLYAKELDSAIVDILCEHRQTDNPLFLRIILDYLRSHADHDTGYKSPQVFYHRFAELLQEASLLDLFLRVLTMWEAHYGEEMVSKSLVLIAVSRRGLSEEDLLALLKTGGIVKNGGTFAWFVFRDVAANFLVSQVGRLSFFHKDLANATRSRYLAKPHSPGVAKEIRKELIDYFLTRQDLARQVVEVPYYLLKNGDMDGLKTYIRQPQVFLEMCWQDQYDLLLYWNSCGLRDDARKMWDEIQQYIFTLTEMEGAKMALRASRWMTAAGHYDIPGSLLEHFLTTTAVEPDMESALAEILAELFQEMGEYNKAQTLYERTLAIKEKVLGKEHPDMACTMNDLALLYGNIGKNNDALPLYERALAIQEKVHGKEHPAVAKTLNNIAGLYQEMGKYGDALPLYERALFTAEKVHGKEHPDVACTLNNLALLHASMGKNNEALPLYERALAIEEKVLGKEHPHVAPTLINLAGLYEEMEKYGDSLWLYGRALTIKEKLLGKEHAEVASLLNNYAGVYQSMGKYVDAQRLYERAQAIQEKVYGKEHLEVASTLHNLAVLRQEMEPRTALGLAVPLYRQALAIREKVLGKEHPAVASTMTTLAGLYEIMGEHKEARLLFERQKGIRAVI